MRESQSRGEAFATFDQVVLAFEKRIFNVVYRYLGDYDEAADVTQETFISAYRSFGRFRGESAVYTWLYQIAVNHCRNRLRSRAHRDAKATASLDAPRAGVDDDRVLEIADLTHAPHTVFEDREFRERLLQAIEALPDEYREVVVLREVDGLAYADIAKATGLSMDNVKTRLSRARAMLRRRLEPFYR